MRVLHLPTNIASQISVTIRALRQLGVDARGLSLNNGRYCDPRELELHQIDSIRRRPFRAVLRRWRWSCELREAVEWADVVHWHFNTSTLPWDMDLKFITRRHKVRLVEFWGTDVRIPRIASQDNPYFAELYRDKPIEAARREAASLATQRRFGDLGFACVLPGRELRRHVQAEWFPAVFDSQSRVMAADYAPAYPDADQPEPLVVHAPSHQARKGSDAVVRAVESLRHDHRFRFELIHGVDRREALDRVALCDVFLDQFVIGSHGLAAVEAMALGKPCVCYINPADQYPDDLPLVHATAETLPAVLSELLRDGARRRELGLKGRAYVERHHDGPKVAQGLIEVYEELLRKRTAG